MQTRQTRLHRGN